MNEFKHDENFIPSKVTKDWWLYTHKSAQKVAGVYMPGMFQTTYYEWQVIGFFLIFFLEGIATYWSFTEGVSITAILVLIFVDLVLAIVAHLWHKEICRLKNENVYTEKEKNTANEQKITKLRVFTYFFYLLILASAFVKCFWFFDTYMILDSTALFVFVCYIIAAILHITCTGYAIFTFAFKIRIGREHNAYINSDGKKLTFDKPLSGHIETNIDVDLAEVGRHKIIKGQDGSYYFLTQGILTDKELREFIFRQKSREQQRVIATAGVEHQYKIWQQ